MRSRPQCQRFGLFVLLVLGLFCIPARADDWPQWLGPQRDGVWRETGLIEKFPTGRQGGPKIVWRTKGDGGYAGPAVAEGRVYVPDFVSTGDKSPSPAQRSELKGTERLLCLRATDGKLLWKHE